MLFVFALRISSFILLINFTFFVPTFFNTPFYMFLLMGRSSTNVMSAFESWAATCETIAIKYNMKMLLLLLQHNHLRRQVFGVENRVAEFQHALWTDCSYWHADIEDRKRRISDWNGVKIRRSFMYRWRVNRWVSCGQCGVQILRYENLFESLTMERKNKFCIYPLGTQHIQLTRPKKTKPISLT